MKTFRFLLLVFVSILIIQTASGQQNYTKVAIIGNSITEGSGLTNPTVNSYPGQLAKMLPDNWQVGNFGVSGRTMLKKGDAPIWNEQKFKDALNFEPNIVVIMLGTNDSKYYNWAHKADFYNDYVSMIDTFSNLASKPEIYICYPPKVFLKIYDIDDVVIHNEIIPFIKQVALDKNVKTIDVYTPTTDKSSLFSDGVHPTIAGANFIAQIFYTGLTGYPYQVIYDENLALKAKISADSHINDSGIGQNPASAVDADLVSPWNFKGFPSRLTIDIGQIFPVDQFQMYFRNHAAAGIQYRIETSTDSMVWNTTLDNSARNDVTLPYSIDKISPTSMRYIRITFTGSSAGYEDLIEIHEFKALKSHGYFHAPAISAKIDRIFYGSLSIIPDQVSQYMSFYTFNKTAKTFELNKSVKDFSKPFTFDYRAATPDPYLYRTSAYLNGTEIVSDTTKVKHVRSTTAIKSIKNEETSFRVYPNPSSGVVRIVAGEMIKEPVQISAFDSKGNLVQIIRKTDSIAKNQGLVWYRTNSAGNKVAPGIYFIRIDGKTIHENLKVILN